MASSQADSTSRLIALRALMTQHNVDLYLVGSEDAHGSEYVDDGDKRRAWLSSFDGSAGTALVGQQVAGLWTDGRYHAQAAQVLSPDWTLHKYTLPGVASWQDYLKQQPRTCRVGFDPALLAVADYTTLSPDVTLVPIAANLVDQVWGPDRPRRTANPVFHLDNKYTGQSINEKLANVRTAIQAEGAVGMIISLLDEVAWILNLRGSDIACNPFFFSFLVLPVGEAPTLFIDIEQVPQKVYEYLCGAGILLEPYDSVVEYLGRYRAQIKPDVSY